MAQLEKTLVIIKHEAMQRALVGKILTRFEEAGLRLVALQMITPTEEQARCHYNQGNDRDWLTKVGSKAKSLYKSNAALKKRFATAEPEEIGTIIYEWSVRQLQGKSVIVAILSGPSAVDKVKTMVGSTVPSEADMATIRGMYSTDSIEHSNARRRAVHNVVHRSSNTREAKREIALWFPKAPA